MEQFIAELMEAWNTHDVDRVVMFYSQDYEGQDVAEAAPQRGQQGIRKSIERYLSAFPDLHLVAEDTVIQDDRIALVWTARGTHKGLLMNIPATGRTVAVRGVSLFTLEGDKIRRGTYIWDVAGLLRAIRLLPDL